MILAKIVQFIHFQPKCEKFRGPPEIPAAHLLRNTDPSNHIFTHSEIIPVRSVFRDKNYLIS